MNALKTIATGIDGVNVVDTAALSDNRGSFARFFCVSELGEMLGSRRVVQINHSRTRAVGAVRGLHYQQSPHAEMKFVRCLRGRVWDVALDLRAGSPTLLRWHAEELTAENTRMLVIPEGCAHGFQVLEPDSELLYLHTAFYAPESEGGVRPDDPLLGIRWPAEITDISRRDRGHPLLESNFRGLSL